MSNETGEVLITIVKVIATIIAMVIGAFVGAFIGAFKAPFYIGLFDQRTQKGSQRPEHQKFQQNEKG